MRRIVVALVATTLFDGVQPWSVPLSSVRSAAQTGPAAARACVWHSKAWLSPAKSLRAAARGRCVLVPLRMAGKWWCFRVRVRDASGFIFD